MKCEDCGSENLAQSAVPGLAACEHCGNVQPATLQEIGVEPSEPEFVPNADVDELILPDQIEVEIGWRSWIVSDEWPAGGQPLLKSVTHQEALWHPGQAVVAKCPRLEGARTTGRGATSKKFRENHEVPDENCGCGLYSAKTLEHLLGMGYPQYNRDASGVWRVIGKVKNWGKVIEGSQGWRAEISYPDELFVPFDAADRLMEPLEEAYKVPVGVKNWLGGKF